MRFLKLVILLSLFSVSLIKAQTRITIDEAVDLALKNNIEIQKQNTVLFKSELQLEESSRLPNPLLNYSREDLKNSSINYNEWIISGSMPINFIWDRWSNISSKEKILQAQKLLLNYQQKRIITDVQKSYTNLHFNDLMLSDLEIALKKIKTIYAIAEHRFNEGDISRYELQRILLELNKLNSLIRRVEVDNTFYHNELNLHLNLNYDILTTQDSYVIQEEPLDLNNLLDIALKKRNDLHALDLLIEGTASELDYNYLKIIPTINLSAGYKKQTDDLSGLVLELNAEIPIFNQSQLKTSETKLEIDFLNKKKIFLTKKIELDVKAAYKKHEEFRMLIQKNDKAILADLIDASSISYEEGELELVDFMYAVNAYIDGIKLYYSTAADYYNSYFELENTIFVQLRNFEN